METPSDGRPPIAVAMEAVSRVTTIVGEMVVPGLIGIWLDGKWGTGFLGLTGFALGLSVAIWHLVLMARTANAAKSKAARRNDLNEDADRRSGESPDRKGN